MSWKDFLQGGEADQLREAEAAKAEAVAGYNAVRRLLKARCDARMRRSKEADTLDWAGGDEVAQEQNAANVRKSRNKV